MTSGIVSAVGWIASSSGGDIGPGFAIPINNAEKAINDSITNGAGEYGWLGITMGSLATSAAQDLKLADTKGAFVYGVFRQSPADTAGILPGDFITQVINEAVAGVCPGRADRGAQEPDESGRQRRESRNHQHRAGQPGPDRRSEPGGLHQEGQRE